MSGFDVVNYMEQGNGLIHLAAYHGQLRMIQRLITQGSFIDWMEGRLISRLFCKSARS